MMFFLLLVCGFDCLFLDAIAIAWYRLSLRSLRGSQLKLQDLDVVVFLEVNTSRNMRLLEQPGGGRTST
jgi:hypothetical protein